MLKRIIVLLICICFLVGILGITLNASAQPVHTRAAMPRNVPPAGAQAMHSINPHPGTGAATWTAAARKAAQPLVVKTAPAAAASPQASADLVGGPALPDPSDTTPGSHPGGAPKPEAVAAARTRYADVWARMNNAQTSLEPSLKMPDLIKPQGTKDTYDGYYGNVFTSFWINYPYVTIGKLYTYDGWCTAALIDYTVIATAAQCLYNTDYNYWIEGWYFVPAEVYGSAPFGGFDVYDAWIMSNWADSKSSATASKYDIGLATLYYDGSGEPAGDYTGWLGAIWNLSSNEVMHTPGYSENAYDLNPGDVTYICVSESYKKGAGTLGMGCAMQYATGSPSIVGFKPFYNNANSNYVNSVVHTYATNKYGNVTDSLGIQFETTNFYYLYLDLCYYDGSCS